MSPPDVNLKKQKRRHWGPLVGIAVGVAFVAVILVAYLAYEVPEDESGDSEIILPTDE